MSWLLKLIDRDKKNIDKVINIEKCLEDGHTPKTIYKLYEIRNHVIKKESIDESTFMEVINKYYIIT